MDKQTKKKTIKQRMLELPKAIKGEKKILIQGSQAGMFAKGDRHVEKRYTVKKIIGKDGKITLELTPYKELMKRREELTKKIVNILALKLDKKELLKDIIDDVGIVELEKLDTAIDRGAIITPKEGCFYFKIKDPRKKKPYQLSLRN